MYTIHAPLSSFLIMKLTTSSAALFILLCGCATRDQANVLDSKARLSDAPASAPESASSTQVQPGDAQSKSEDDTDKGSGRFSPQDCPLARYGLGYVDRDVQVPEELTLLREGNAAFRDDRPEEALTIWQCVIDDHPGTPAAETALLNVGGLLQSQGKYHEAIRVYRQIVPADQETPAKRESSEISFEGNGRHYACVRISVCFEALGEYSEAARYAQLARHQYREWDFCGVYLGWKEDQLDKRIAVLGERARASEKGHDQNSDNVRQQPLDGETLKVENSTGFSPHDCSGASDSQEGDGSDAEVPTDVALLRQGNAACLEGRSNAALASWQSVIDEHPDTRASTTAVLNIGGLLREEGKYREAIRAYRRLLPPAEGKDPASCVDARKSKAHSPAIDDSDRHYACLELSACSESLGDFSAAARYARMARDGYRQWGHFGSFTKWRQSWLNERIAILEKSARESQK